MQNVEEMLESYNFGELRRQVAVVRTYIKYSKLDMLLYFDHNIGDNQISAELDKYSLKELEGFLETVKLLEL